MIKYAIFYRPDSNIIYRKIKYKDDTLLADLCWDICTKEPLNSWHNMSATDLVALYEEYGFIEADDMQYFDFTVE